ncbi:MAG: polyphosphate kinase 2 family protein [Oscillospiraceae bacterium]|jgi:PPK2 family polyphosphate:nucleotide phosphotransferase|nr:polyphosphate kinase 2 family protein [Oscillospiraceae bacterium]
MVTDFCRFVGGKKFSYKKFNAKGESKKYDREKIEKKMASDILKMRELQDKFYAGSQESFLVIFQAMDAAGKDGAIKHVMSGINPQGVKVSSFKQPSAEEAAHDYLWRACRALPKKGEIGIFNRSYYEDVLIAKVHKLYKIQRLPQRCMTKDIIKRRYEEIVNFEKYLWQNGVTVVKFFLCISKSEQKKRFMSRIVDTSKNWKFSQSDLKERDYWDDYMKAYESAINSTSRKNAPWYIVPSDKKWYARAFVLSVMLETLKKINPQYPKFQKEKRGKLLEYKKILLSEKD